MNAYAVYDLDELGEAQGVRNWACCVEHARTLSAGAPFEENHDFVAGTVCEVCGVVLVNQ